MTKIMMMRTMLQHIQNHIKTHFRAHTANDICFTRARRCSCQSLPPSQDNKHKDEATQDSYGSTSDGSPARRQPNGKLRSITIGAAQKKTKEHLWSQVSRRVGLQQYEASASEALDIHSPEKSTKPGDVTGYPQGSGKRPRYSDSVVQGALRQSKLPCCAQWLL